MPYKQTLIVSLCLSLLTSHALSKTESAKLDTLNGTWHLRIMDGMEVRAARAILNFDTKKMILSGFDSCNSISGALQVNNDCNNSNDSNITSQLTSTTMACRESIHSYVSKRLHETVKEGFSFMQSKRNGVDGITIKSSSHELFFKKMERNDAPKSGNFNFNLNFLKN